MAEWEDGKNPLLNELVIDNISKYLSFKELKVCRGLNHLWKKTTNKRFLKLCPSIFLIDPNTPLFGLNTYLSSEIIMPIAQFMDIYSDLENPLPHAQLIRQYRNFALLALPEECIPIFYNFMTAVGPQMSSLQLLYGQVLSNVQALIDVVSCKYTYNLEKLTLVKLEKTLFNKQSDYEPVRMKGKENNNLRRLTVAIGYKIDWFDVFSLYPQLDALRCTAMPVEVFEGIATGLVTLRKANKTKSKLKELSVLNVPLIHSSKVDTKARWQSILDKLQTANLPLERISLDDSSSEISSALIQLYEQNLKTLAFKGTIPRPFPLMKALEDLCVHSCNDLTFLPKVPNLKSLDFQPWITKGRVWFPESTPKSLVSLTTFKSDNCQEWNVTQMEQLLLWMPNVQILEMKLDNTTFPWICQHFPNLKELIVWGVKLDDSGVVGDFDETSEVDGCLPNITNLKALEIFKMAGSFNAGLTEKSVFNGFSLMPKLSNLTIYVKSELNADAIFALHRRIKNVQVNICPKIIRNLIRN